MQTYNDILKGTIEDDVKELNAYKAHYLSQAALARDCGKDKVANAYLEATVELERCVQGLSTIPMLDRIS